jgi:predicted  nucleic acid-binding Zn-ribbon protein
MINARPSTARPRPPDSEVRAEALSVDAPCPATSRADLKALLRVASIDAELWRLDRALEEIGSLMSRQRADLAALRALVEADRPKTAGANPRRAEGAGDRPKQPYGKERAYAELARELARDEADALGMSAELRRKTAWFGAQRQAHLERMTPSLSGLYAAALRDGRRPAVAAARDGVCSGCGARLAPEAGRLLRDAGHVAPCPGCARLLHGPGWSERELTAPTLRPFRRRP